MQQLARFDPNSKDSSPAIAFGPVPSRRLGRSLGINNIPPKICTYSCVYCQVGPTLERIVEPRLFYPPAVIAEVVAARVEQIRERGETVDHLTFVPDGEPTLDAGLGESIRLLRPLDISIAVISNGSLLTRPDIRNDLGGADWVSVKIDAGTEETWRRVNRPHPALDFGEVMGGIAAFADEFAGALVSETMLVHGINDDEAETAAIGAFLSRLDLQTAYLAIPTRPTPYPSITAPDEMTVNRAYHVLADRVPQVEYLVGYEGDAFAASGDARADLLAITAVHPMRESAVDDLLRRTGTGRDVVEDMLRDGLLARVTYRGERFYTRRWRR